MEGSEHRQGEKEVKEEDRAEGGAGEASLSLRKGSTRGREGEQQHGKVWITKGRSRVSRDTKAEAQTVMGSRRDGPEGTSQKGPACGLARGNTHLDLSDLESEGCAPQN